jgi:hypothetical protein
MVSSGIVAVNLEDIRVQRDARCADHARVLFAEV